MGMGMSGGRRGRRGAFTDINVTPLVDVMLVLLVVFMVTAPLLATGLRVELPQVQAHNTPIKDTKLVVSVDEDEKIFFPDDETEVTENLEQVLKGSARIQKERELYIRAHKDARYRVVARVVAAARAAGVVGLNLLVEPEVVDE